MRIYIIGNDGITLCRDAPATVNDGEVAVASKEELPAAPLSRARLEDERPQLSEFLTPIIVKIRKTPNGALLGEERNRRRQKLIPRPSKRVVSVTIS